MSRSPAAITPAKKRLMIEAFADGATMRIACGVARVVPWSAYRWLKRGREELEVWAAECEDLAETLEPGDPAPKWPPLTEHSRFFLDITEAIASRDRRWVKKLESWDEKGQGWTKYAWLLERTAPGEFALKEGVQRVEHTGADGGAIKIEDRSASLADVARVLEAVGALAQLGRGTDRAALPDNRALLPAPPNS